MKPFLLSIEQATPLLRKGEIVAYPTEAIYGLGCDPDNSDALQRLLRLKQRTQAKGFILIASEIAQVLPFIDITKLTSSRWEQIQETWPGPYTWVFPMTNRVSPLLSGQYSTVAVRVTAHPVAKDLCDAFGGPIISTSANLTSQAPFKTAQEIAAGFGPQIAGIVEGNLGDALAPTTIQDALTCERYR